MARTLAFEVFCVAVISGRTKQCWYSFRLLVLSYRQLVVEFRHSGKTQN
jgi:hypothetical protein